MNSAHEELTRFSDVVGLIYEGAMEPGRWTKDILPAMADYIHAPIANLLTPYRTPSDGGFIYQHGMLRQQLELYVSRYHAEDIHGQVAAAKRLVFEGNVALDTDMISREQLLESKYYKEYLSRDKNMGQLMSAVVFGADSISAVPAAVCTFWRSFDAPMYAEQDRERLKLLVPHISRSLGVMQRIRSAELTVATSLAALDRLPMGVLLTDATGAVTFANRAAQRMLEACDGLRLKKFTRASGLGNLSADSELANRAIAAALRSTLNRDPYSTEHFSDCVRVPRSSGNTAYTLQFSALGSHTEFGAGNAASAIVFLADGAQQVKVEPGLLQSAYGLSPAEARVAIALLECSSAQEVADYLNVSSNTVRTQIKQIYAKLGVDTRARFVKLMMGLAIH